MYLLITPQRTPRKTIKYYVPFIKREMGIESGSASYHSETKMYLRVIRGSGDTVEIIHVMDGGWREGKARTIHMAGCKLFSDTLYPLITDLKESHFSHPEKDVLIVFWQRRGAKMWKTITKT